MATSFSIARASLDSPTASTVLVTGGSSGIGLATALLLHSFPSNNLIILDIQTPPEPLASSTRVLFQKTDITSWPSQRDGFSAGYKKFGAIDHVFVNAGIWEYKDQIFDEELDEDGELREPDRRVVNLNLNAANDTVKLAVFYLRKNGEKGGSIVLTASLAGYLASARAPHYSAAKHGIVGLMRALKPQVVKANIAISLVAPGITTTPILISVEETDSPEKSAQRMRDEGVPVNEPEDVANAVVYLFGEGIKANGKGLLIQGGRIVDVEEGLARSRATWMGSEQLDLMKNKGPRAVSGKL